jgi:1-acyl-sn-glycerol-3-phosphate acyltransferase
MQNNPTHRSGIVYGLFSLFILISYSTLFFFPIFIIGLIKLIPIQRVRLYCAIAIDYLVRAWTTITVYSVNCLIPIRWKINGLSKFNPKEWYLLVSNHQSWLDILILIHCFNRKIPVLKFFVKEQLKWIPIFGFAWWAMGCPFMKRYSKEYLAKHPHKKGQDIIATQKALKLFNSYPSAVINFIEGTRFSPQKHSIQSSPYQYLLKPKAGGIGQIISGMGKQLKTMIDVTIVYPDNNKSLWNFLCRRMHSICIHIRSIPIPEQFHQSNLASDSLDIQTAFRDWLNEQWAQKDEIIHSIHAG